MKKLLTITAVTFLLSTSAIAANTTHEAGERYQDLTYDYFNGKNHVSDNIKKVIANDIQTSPRVLKILAQDKDKSISLLAKQNLKSLRYN